MGFIENAIATATCRAFKPHCPRVLKVDLGYEINIVGIAIQGQHDTPNFVTEFSVSYSIHMETWLDYSESDGGTALVSSCLFVLCGLVVR